MSRTTTAVWKRIVRQVRAQGVANGTPCHLCNGARGPIDYRTQAAADRDAQESGQWWLVGAPRPLALHVDHLTPSAAGGEDTLDNVAPSHAWCNQSAGAKGAAPQAPRTRKPRRTAGEWRPMSGQGEAYAGMDIPGRRTSTHVFVAAGSA